jgi:hypothetical protein
MSVVSLWLLKMSSFRHCPRVVKQVELKKKTVSATDQNGCGFVKLKQKLGAISKAKIKGGISVRQ